MPIVKHDGWAYFCTDTGSFFIDHLDANNEVVRSKISAEYADKLRYEKDEAIIEIDPSTIATTTYVDNAVANKANKSTTLAGYGITNAYTKSEVDQAIANIPTSDVSGQIDEHNADSNAHSDIRALIDAKSDFSGSYNDLTDKPEIPSIAGLATVSYVDEQIGSIDVPTSLAELSADETHRTVTDDEKASWNAKSNFSGSYNDLTNKPTIPSIAGLATTQYVDQEISKIDIPNDLADLSTDENHRVVTDAEKATWNAKSNFSGNYNDLTNKPSIPSIAGLATESYVDAELANYQLKGDYAGIEHDHDIADVSGLQEALDKKVETVSGKGLSTNDLTATLKSNYDTAYTHSQSDHAPVGAQANVVETIQVNGTTQKVSNKAVNITVPTKTSELTHDSGFLTAHQDISGKADKSNTYTKDEVDGLVASTFHYKGTKTNYSDLPSSGNVIGDVWNITNASANNKAGDNVAWSGAGWDVLAGTVDLSAYYTGAKVDGLLEGYAKKATTLAGYGITDAYTQMQINGKLDGKAETGHTHTVTHKPAGSVTSSFTGTAAEHNHNFSGTKATISTTYTPAGSVSSTFKGTEHGHSFTGSAVNSGKPDTTNVTTIYSITGVGSLPSASLDKGALPSLTFNKGTYPTLTFSAGTLPSASHTAASLTSAIANRCMTVTFTADSHSFSAGSLPSASLSAGTLPSVTFNAGSLPSLTFSAGSLPTRSSAISMPNTNHTHSVTAAGTVNGNTAGGTVSSGFTGTQATIAAEYTPAGTVANKSVTPAGTVSSSFSGTSATLTTSAGA